MPENKTRPTGASVDAFIAAVENERRRQDARTVLELMREVTREEPVMWGPSIVGFGDYRYQYDSGREGSWASTGRVARASTSINSTTWISTC